MNKLRKFLPYLLFSCKKVSALISINQAHRTPMQRIIIGYHKFICKACHNYQQQNNTIEASFSKSFHKNESIALSKEKKQHIISVLSKL